MSCIGLDHNVIFGLDIFPSRGIMARIVSRRVKREVLAGSCSVAYRMHNVQWRYVRPRLHGPNYPAVG